MPASKPKLPILNRAHPLARGLVGAWLIYEGSGTTVYDLSPLRRHGAISGNPTWGASEHGRVLVFDGTGDYVSFSAANLPIAGAPYTLLARFKSTRATFNSTTGAGLIGYGDSSAGKANRLRLLYDSESIAGTGLGLVNYWWGNDIRERTALTRLNVWYTAAATYDGTTRRLLINGAVIKSDTPGSNNAQRTNAAFGASSANNEVFEGEIAIAAIYNRALTPAEVRALHADPYQAFRLPNFYGPLLTSVVEGATVRLTWQDNSSAETLFSIERSATSALVGFSEIDTVAGNTTLYNDTGLPPGTYWYRVRAFDGSQFSDYSNVAEITVLA